MTPISTRFGLAALCSAFVLLLTAAPAFSAPTLPTNFRDDPVTALDRPTGLAFTPDGRLLVAGQAGTVNVFRNGTLQQPPALDISAKTCSDQERGMMAVAVDPAFASNHFIYVYYTWNKAGRVRVRQQRRHHRRSTASRASCSAQRHGRRRPARRS